MKKVNFILGVFLLGTLFLTGCKDDPTPDPSQVAYDAASVSKGGIMYDKFWSTEASFDQTNSKLATLNAKGDFFRCKQCHGWDGLGSAGSYINRGPKTSRPTVSSINLYQIAKTKTYQELFDAMKKSTERRDIAFDLATYDPASNKTEGDKMPNYSQLLTDAQIWDIVKFLKEGMFDVSQLYDATYSGTYPTGSTTFANVGKGGNAAAGNIYYTAKCIACHGADGKLIPNLDGTTGMTVGKFARTKANELQHKIHFGQLGSTMLGDFTLTLPQAKDLYKAISDATNFPD